MFILVLFLFLFLLGIHIFNNHPRGFLQLIMIGVHSCHSHMVCEPVALASSGSSLKMQTLRLHPRPPEPESAF